MASNKVDVMAGDTERGPSRSVIGNFPISEIIEDPTKGIWYFDDFLATPNIPAGAEGVVGIYKGFADTGGSVTEADIVGGVKTFSSDGDDEGASLATVSKPFQIDRGLGRCVFGCRMKTSTITDTKHGIFFGLIDTSTLSATVPIAAAGTLADENFVGFHRLEGDGDMIDTVYKANGVTQVTLQADAITLVADTWVKLEAIFEPDKDNAGRNRLSFYKDGTRLATSYEIPAADGTDFPNDVRLGLIFAVLNATGTTPGNSSVDWWYAGQRMDL